MRRDLRICSIRESRWCPVPVTSKSCRVRIELWHPGLRASQLGSNDQKEFMRKRIEDAIRTYETRFQHVRVTMTSNSSEGALYFRIEGTLYAEPAPEP